jgi:autophagy-related protein 2
VKMPMVRIEVRCPPPLHASGPRSGSFVVDFHDIHLSPGISPQTRKMETRFEDNDVADEPVSHMRETQVHAIFSLELRRMVVAYAPCGEKKANAVISLGPLSSSRKRELTSAGFGASPSSADTVLPNPQSNIHVIVSQSIHTASASKPSGTVVTVDIPCVHAHLEKQISDGLQLWADDIRQLLEQTFGDLVGDTDTERASSRDTSIVGSRFFAKSRYGSESDTGSVSNKPHVGETILKVTVSEGTYILLC